MNIDCFLKRYLEPLMHDKGDEFFESICLMTGGTTSCRIGKLLNFAVSQMDPNECYVEVGVFTGNTLCQAGYNNDRVCIGIDSYLPEEMKQMTQMTPEFVRDRCLQNINCMSRGKTRLIHSDFRNVKKEDIGMPVAVSFIDGKHDYPSVIENLEWLHPMLADHAVLIFDDVNYVEVSMAIEKWMEAHGHTYDLLAYIKPFYGTDGKNLSSRDRFLNNGVCVMRYHKDPLSNTLSYDPNKAGWTSAEVMAGKKL